MSRADRRHRDASLRTEHRVRDREHHDRWNKSIWITELGGGSGCTFDQAECAKTVVPRIDRLGFVEVFLELW